MLDERGRNAWIRQWEALLEGLGEVLELGDRFEPELSPGAAMHPMQMTLTAATAGVALALALTPASLPGAVPVPPAAPGASFDGHRATVSGTPPAPPGCWVRGPREDLELRISELDSASVELEGGTVKVCYSRPRKLGRPVMGRLVPYGEPWRLGANEATAIHVPFRAEIAGVDVAPGWYSLYAVPGRETWDVVVNRERRRWGIPLDREVRGNDIGSGTVPVEQLSETVERLTIRLERASADTAEMVVSWERTRVRVPVVMRHRP